MDNRIIPPCAFCRGKDCGGRKDCDCASCAHLEECPRFPAPTVRITDKCTQECPHCCFSCTPRGKRAMSPETADLTAAFCVLSGARRVNVMGGEFFLNRDWEKIVGSFLSAGLAVSLVTSGDFVDDASVLPGLVRLSGMGVLTVRVSDDVWHTGRNTDRACQCLAEADVPHVRQEEGDGRGKSPFDNPLVPVGRGEMSVDGLFSMFATYCGHDKGRTGFLIDEDGTVSRCPFGLYQVADVRDGQEALDDLLDLIGRFDSAFIPSCRQCVRIHDEWVRRRLEAD